jgi:beta-N-acetylhexosaminidase
MHGLSIPESTFSRETRAKISSFVAALCLLAFGPFSLAETAQETAAKMSIEQKVGQVMIWSFQGSEFSPALEETLTKYQLGALIFFGRNVVTTHQVAKLNTEIQKVASKKLKAPLFLMVDQEGGVVTRVKISTPLPSALALGKTDDPVFVQNFAKIKGDLINALGFNVNLAPVLDISDPKQDTFIGNRTFGGEPDSVSSLSMAYSRGMSLAGILPTAKHFPGHGGEISDSHKTTPTKMATAEEIEGRDLIPFKEFASASTPGAIMTAHLALPNIDPQGLAATYSSVLVKDWLRTKLGFKGLIVTDDLEMTGAAISADIGERAIRAFLAGHDMVMLAGPFTNQRRAFRSMVYAVKDGRIPEARLTESVARILEAKSQLKLNSAKVDEGKATVAIRKLHGLTKEVMQRNFKVAMEEQPRSWPEVKRGTQAVVFSSTLGFYYRFHQAFAGRARHYKLAHDTLDNVAEELAKDKTAIGVFYASGSKTAVWLNSLTPELKAKLIVVNCNHPGKVENQDAYMAVLNLNSHSPESGEWLAAELSKPRSVPPPTPAPAPPAIEPLVEEFKPPTPLSEDLPPAPVAPPGSEEIRTPAGDLEYWNPKEISD